MARGNYPSSKQDQYVLRLPDGMRDEIKKAAEANGRSMNAEIISRIEAARSPSADLETEDLKQRLTREQQTNERIEKMLEDTIKISDGYRKLFHNERQKVVENAKMVESLAHVLLNLDQAPPPEMLSLVQNISDLAKSGRESYEKLDEENIAEQKVNLSKAWAELKRSNELKQPTDRSASGKTK